MYENNYLKHYGVVGMKRGVRRKQNKLTKMSRKADMYDSKSKAWDREANVLEKKSKKKKKKSGRLWTKF